MIEVEIGDKTFWINEFEFNFDDNALEAEVVKEISLDVTIHW